MGRGIIPPALRRTPAAPPSSPTLLEGISIILAGERGLAELYQRYGQEASDPALRKKWHEFGEQAQAHVRITEGVITALQGDPYYRATGVSDVERCTNAMLSVDAQGAVGDLVRLSRLVAAESLSGEYWRSASKLAPRAKDPSVARILREAAAVINQEKDQHIRWNTSRLDSQMQKVMSGG